MTPRATSQSSALTGRHSRRAVMGGLAMLAGGAGFVRLAHAQDATPPPSTPTIQNTGVGEMPTYGGMRPGPVGDLPPESTSSATIPVGIVIEAASIDAEVETLNIVNGKMEDPTGPWVVSWYQQSAELGEPGNVMLAGHVDYWGVGPSVFYHVRDLAAGDDILLTGQNGLPYRYQVTSNDTYSLDELVSGKMAELAATTDNQVATIFTCGGEFDYVNGEYLSRTVIRAERVRDTPGEATPPA